MFCACAWPPIAGPVNYVCRCVRVFLLCMYNTSDCPSLQRRKPASCLKESVSEFFASYNTLHIKSSARHHVRWIYSFIGTNLCLVRSTCLTLRLLISYIYESPSKARNANVVYIWTYVWQRWNSLFLLCQLYVCQWFALLTEPLNSLVTTLYVPSFYAVEFLCHITLKIIWITFNKTLQFLGQDLHVPYICLCFI